MFLVFNKEKISAYIVSVLTVCFLFFIASTTNTKNENVSETSSNIQNVNTNNVQEWNNTKKIGNNIQKNSNISD